MKRSITDVLRLVCLLLAPLTCHGYGIGDGAWVHPVETAFDPWESHEQVASPTPTATFKDIAAMPDLQRRQENNPTICGYGFGLIDDPATCLSDQVCVTSTNYVGCCYPDGKCQDRKNPTSCLDYTAFTGGLCARASAGTMCCSLSTQGFCNTWTYGDVQSLTILACAPQPTAIVLFRAAETNPTTTPRSTARSSATQRPSSPTTLSSTTNPSKSVSSTPAPSIPVPPPPAQTSSPRVGTIVGIVIGILALLAGILAFILIRRRNQKRAAAAEDSGTDSRKRFAVSTLGEPPAYNQYSPYGETAPTTFPLAPAPAPVMTSPSHTAAAGRQTPPVLMTPSPEPKRFLGGQSYFFQNAYVAEREPPRVLMSPPPAEMPAAEPVERAGTPVVGAGAGAGAGAGERGYELQDRRYRYPRPGRGMI